MKYSVSQIIEAIRAKSFPAKGKADFDVERLLIDSRSLIEPQGTMFVALKTSKNDGHTYIPELYQRGVRVFLVNEGYADMEEYPDAIFVLVADTLKALQKLAAWHRSHFTYPVLAITGSNGKTIVKEWLYQLLSP